MGISSTCIQSCRDEDAKNGEDQKGRRHKVMNRYEDMNRQIQVLWTDMKIWTDKFRWVKSDTLAAIDSSIYCQSYKPHLVTAGIQFNTDSAGTTHYICPSPDSAGTTHYICLFPDSAGTMHYICLFLQCITFSQIMVEKWRMNKWLLTATDLRGWGAMSVTVSKTTYHSNSLCNASNASLWGRVGHPGCLPNIK